MNLSKLKEPFPVCDIEWRIGQAGKNPKGIWANALAYIQARAIMDRLDEVVGPNNWKVDYSILPQGVICRLSLKVGDEWITKEDGAEPTEIEAFKGGISSALKRAGTVWGIGRYLYNVDSNFVETSEEPKPGYKRGYIKKDNLTFYWKEPQLPSWALPKNEVTSPTKEVVDTKTKSNPEACEHKWFKSKYNENEDYCSKCKAKRPRQ